ncbi:YitT family protein [Candidatus Similichlamydia laticola]|uniref:Arginine/ornithine antiporter ArcD n=1 Tax=Candidatus Similichlamydia laticola TaxID=2170265 RepID=A0A369KCI9_9BACT|nr:YitT family protein [Candidatus Similichlamydia laticola]RDB31628.1 Arginine/ornithine antiporter ArcD [Candidatus Similichlamydia laticola]
MVSFSEKQGTSRKILSRVSSCCFIVLGALLTAFSLHFFLLPNKLIDGGTVGLAILVTQFLETPSRLPLAVLILSFPFVLLAHRHIGRQFVMRMLLAAMSFSFGLYLMEGLETHFVGDILEIVVFGGITLGCGIGLIIRNGGCLDGSEIVAILVNRRFGYTVGQVIVAFNVLIFTIAGFLYSDWNSALRSLMTYFVAYKIIDMVLQGFDEVKAVTIISKRPKEVAEAIIREIGVGITIMYGRGGFSGDNREILYIIIERLQLVELKSVVLREDTEAFIAIEDLHEVVTGTGTGPVLGHRKKRKKKTSH